MKRFIRRLLFIPQPKISAEEALRIAFNESNKAGEQWDPKLIEGLKYWTVWTPKNYKGAMHIIIDQQTGRIVYSYALPR